MSSNIELTPYNKRIMNTMILMLESWLENNPDKSEFDIYIKNLDLNVEIKSVKKTDDLKFNDDIIIFKNQNNK